MADSNVKEVAGDVVQSTPVVEEKTVTGEVPEWKGYTAIASLVIGVISLCAAIIPCCGCPTSVIGVVCGVLGLPSDKKTLATVGMVLSILGFVITLGVFIFNLVTGSANYDWDFDTNW